MGKMVMTSIKKRYYTNLDVFKIADFLYNFTGLHPTRKNVSLKLKLLVSFLVNVFGHVTIVIHLYRDWKGIESLENVATLLGTFEVR